MFIKDKNFFKNFNKKTLFSESTTILTSLSLIVFISILFLSPEEFSNAVTDINSFLLKKLGLLYSLFAAVCFILSVFISIKYGNIRIGGKNAKAEFSTLAWLSMLFSAGIGTGLMYSGVYEPLSHYLNAPHLSDLPDLEKYHASLSLTYFHWGFVAWSIYSLFGVAFAYFNFNFNLKSGMKFDQFISKKYSLLRPFVQIPIALSILFGLVSTFVIASQQISAGLKNFSAPPEIVILIVTLIASLSALSGIRRGVKLLSLLNIFIALFIFLFFLLFSDLSFYASSTLNSLFLHFKSLGTHLTLDPFNTPEPWLKNWTFLYWAWWAAWVPFVSVFIAQISYGRTFREVISLAVTIPSFVSFLWFSLFGSYGFLSHHQKSADFTSLLHSSPEESLFAIVSSLPFSAFVSVLILICVSLFYITSSDSGSIVLSELTSPESTLKTSWKRKIYWSLLEGFLAYLLIQLSAIDTIKKLITLFSLPLVFYLFFVLVIFIIKLAHNDGHKS